MVDGGPSRKVVREKAPLAATSHGIEDGIEDLTWAMDSGSSIVFRNGQVRFDVVPLSIGEVRWVRLSHTC